MLETCRPYLRLQMHVTGYIRAEDPSRPVHYEGGGFTTPATDIICPMYARVAQIEAFAAMAPESERRPGAKPWGFTSFIASAAV
jgi:beta-galactosidase/beta-glucuronidase